MSFRRAVRAREAVYLTAIAHGLLLVALYFGRGAGVTGGPEPERSYRYRHWSHWRVGCVCVCVCRTYSNSNSEKWIESTI